MNMMSDPPRTDGVHGVGNFFDQLKHALHQMDGMLKQRETMRERFARRFNVAEMAGLCGVDRRYLSKLLSNVAEDDPDLPQGVRSGKEKTYSLDEMLLIRSMLGTMSTLRRGDKYVHWRRPGERLKVVSFFSQKGGTGKSLSSAHFAQYLVMNYGLRVGIIDADPQATSSLYFCKSVEDVIGGEYPSMADFMGVDLENFGHIGEPSGEELHEMWSPTAWPNIKMMYGSMEIQNIDIALTNRGGMGVYRNLHEAIQRWEKANPPVTEYEDLRNEDGVFDFDLYEKARHETLDLIIIDQQPSLTISQLNGIFAATNVVIPQTMKGFDLHTLTSFADQMSEVTKVIGHNPGGEDILNGKLCPGPHVVLPSIVQETNQADTNLIVDIAKRAPGVISKVFYSRSDAVANAADDYMSIYEYEPPRTRRASAKRFLEAANAVNDYLAHMVIPDLPERGHAAKFLSDIWDLD